MRHSVMLNEGEERMLKELQADFGFRFQEFCRTELVERYRKLKPAYTKPTKEPDPFDGMSDADYCIKVKGGEVDGEMCIIRNPNNPALSTKIPLSKIRTVS